MYEGCLACNLHVRVKGDVLAAPRPRITVRPSVAQVRFIEGRGKKAPAPLRSPNCILSRNYRKIA